MKSNDFIYGNQRPWYVQPGKHLHSNKQHVYLWVGACVRPRPGPHGFSVFTAWNMRIIGSAYIFELLLGCEGLRTAK